MILELLIYGVHEAPRHLRLKPEGEIHDGLGCRPIVFHAGGSVHGRPAGEVERELLGLEGVDVLADQRIGRRIPDVGGRGRQGVVPQEHRGSRGRNPRDQTAIIDLDAEEFGERPLAECDLGVER